MTQFARSRAMHQYYRDFFTKTIYLPEADALPAHLVAEILNFRNSDFAALEPMIEAAQTGLAAEQEQALKQMMCAIALANQAFDSKLQGKQVPFPAEQAQQVTDLVVLALQHDSSVNMLVTAIQILFRVNEIASVLFLIANNLDRLKESAPVLKILLLICLLEEDYHQAQAIIQQLTADSSLIGEDPFTLLMIVCGIARLGGCPESFIDFRPLTQTDYQLDSERYQWIIPRVASDRPTVLVACDKHYYLEHALPLLCSIYESNQAALNVHLHLYNCDDTLAAHVKEVAISFPEFNLSVTSESFPIVKGINVHYASRRFVFMRYALEHFTGPLIALDADCLVRKPWTEVATMLCGSELVLTQCEGTPAWEDVFGGFMCVTPGPLSKKYFDIVARFIDSNLNSGNAQWFLDQVALAFALDTLMPMEQMAIQRVPLFSMIDLNHSRDVFCWFVTTQKTASGSYQDYKNALKAKYLEQA